MPIYYSILKPAFDILNFKLKILTSNNGNTVEIPLYAIVVLLFVVEFVLVSL